MKTKLTLRVDSELIERAKQHAARRGKSLSQFVGELFRFLDEEESEEVLEGPVARALRGSLKRGSQEDHRQHLARKHR